jgi:hypothetical protein
MQARTHLSFGVHVTRKSFGITFTKWSLLLVLAMGVNSTKVWAEQSNGADADKQTIQKLLQRIDTLESQVARLNAAMQQTPPTTPGPATPPVPPPSEAQTEMESEMQPEAAAVDFSKTLLRIRGFGDIDLRGDNRRGDTTSFALGQLNLFVTSNISEKFKFLSEIVFEAGPDNAFGVDIERYLLLYSHNDYFNLAFGRYHTAIGYYNTAYHHSTWLQTATGRPFLFAFEDQGGILPIHNVGVSASGLIPSGPLGLHYVAELGNGRASRSPQAEAVQNVVDENNHKAFNLALFARPEHARGLQTGFSVYHDLLTPAAAPPIGQTILDTYAVFVRPSFEWLNEFLLIRDAPMGSRVFHTPGFYTQISMLFGSYRPYFRYQYVNAPNNEPVFGPIYNTPVGLQQGPSLGVRYNASESVAFKLQYDYTAFRRQAAVNGLTLQAGFTF